MMTIGTPARARRQAGFGHRRVVLQRGDGAVDRREHGPLADRRAGHRGEHLEQRRHELRLAHLVLHMLGAAGERDRLDLEVGGDRVEVAGRDRRPDVVAVGHGVEQRHDRAQVGGAAVVALAGGVVQDVRRRAVTREREVPSPTSTSWAGSRAASSTCRGASARQDSTSSRGRRALSASQSTTAPASSSRSIASGVLKAMPVPSRISRVCSCRSTFSWSVRKLIRALAMEPPRPCGPAARPGCGSPRRRDPGVRRRRARRAPARAAAGSR